MLVVAASRKLLQLQFQTRMLVVATYLEYYKYRTRDPNAGSSHVA